MGVCRLHMLEREAQKIVFHFRVPWDSGDGAQSLTLPWAAAFALYLSDMRGF